jgi:hypothetical protein
MMGDACMDAGGRMTQDAKVEGWGEGDIYTNIIIAFPLAGGRLGWG